MTPQGDRASFGDARARNAMATTVYGALVDTGKLSGHLLLTYRCPLRCAVLHVINTPQGVIFGWPRYKTSTETTARQSSAGGRAANTEDGNRHWKRRASYVDTVDSAGVQCDHLQRSLELTDIQAQLDGENFPRDVVLLP